MQVTDFTSDSPGKLVPTVEGALAFVPSPLPPSLDLDIGTIGLLSSADHAVGRLVGTTAHLVNPFLVGAPLLRREAILSSRIEGTVTTPEELALLEAGQQAREPAAGSDTLEVLNYVRAMQHGLERLNELPVCLRLIREIHAHLMAGGRGQEETPGEFRRAQNYIAPPGDPISAARFVPPTVLEMEAALDHFERYLHAESDLPILLKLAFVHYQFETIHPFRDGNGRVGRLLIPMMLIVAGRLSQPLLYLSGFFDQHRGDYYDLLLNVSLSGNWLAWIRFFLRAVQESADDATSRVQGLLQMRERYQLTFQSARSSALLQKLIDELFKSPSITIGQTAELLGVTPAAARNNLRKLEEAGIIREVTKRTRGQVFVAVGVLGFSEAHPSLLSSEGKRAGGRPRHSLASL